MLKAVIIEDEIHSLEALKLLIQDFCPELKIAATASSVETGIEELKKHKPDLVFLDIEIGTGTGFDVLEQVKNFDFEVIFTTAFEHYALKAIKFSAIDYLLKPIDVDDLQKAVQKVNKKRDVLSQNQKLVTLLSNIRTTNEQKQTIILSTSEGYEFVPVSDIIYCQADGSYTRFHLNHKRELLVSKHLKEYEKLLSDHNFYRIHQSYLINMAEVGKLMRTDGGYLIMRNGDEIGLSPKKKEEFMALMREF